MQSLKGQNDLGWLLRQTIQHPSLCLPTDTEEAQFDQLCEGLQHLVELIAKKDVHIIIGDRKAKIGSQEIAGIIGKFGLEVQNEAGQRLTILSSGHAGHWKHPFATTEKMTLHMNIIRQSI